LLNKSLVVEVPVKGPDSERFARTHQVGPLAWGFGLDMSVGGTCQIGHPSSPNRVFVGLPTYLIWTLAPAYPDLWTTVVRVSEDYFADAAEDSPIPLDPHGLLSSFLLTLPLLVGQAVAYVDRVTDGNAP
jgi:hypothetical protein